ncbi:MAG: hypothetical protein MJ211_10355 [Bacteroidales bacterium]|nr:hypothetical protein [Bacteroidales bacterium]
MNFVKFIFVFILSFSLFSCSPTIKETKKVESTPVLWPDYIGVTIPNNIAPMNFSTINFDSIQFIDVKVVLPNNEEFYFSGDNYIDFPFDKWTDILQKSKGQNIELYVSEVINNIKYVYNPFSIFIANYEIDPFLCYRLISPGYQIYSKMGIYCRNLTNFEQNAVVENKLINSNCINCHSFCKGNTDLSTFHIRGDLGSTVLKNNDNLTICNAKTEKYKLNCVYPYWHPSGNFIAYSQNNTVQSFHCSDENRVEVFDMESRVVVYDIQDNKLISSPLFDCDTTFTSEPSFSPDGKYLYFISTDTLNMLRKTTEPIYDICRIEFNSESKTFGNSVDTLVKASLDSCSAAFPRPSYDGKYLLYTKCDYGQFAIWHTEADLWLLNLETNQTYPLSKANSNNVESYHSWSTNSHWIVFESRRDDGFYTRAYIAYIDDNGQAQKAFVVPQQNPEHNRNLMYSYNVPEFATSEFKIDKAILENKLKNGEKLQFGY